MGKRVIIIDGDMQRSASKVALAREEHISSGPVIALAQAQDKSVHSMIRENAKDYDVIIVDATGTDNPVQRYAMFLADRLLLPLAPTFMEISSLDEIEKMVEGARMNRSPDMPDLKVQTFLTKAFPEGSDNEEAIEDLLDLESEGYEYVDAPLVYRKSFARCLRRGLSVWEHKNRQRRKDNQAMIEMGRLFKSIYHIDPLTSWPLSFREGVANYDEKLIKH